MDIDDYEEDMMLDEDEFIAPSPTGEEPYEEGASRFANTRQQNVKVVDKNFFNGKYFAGVSCHGNTHAISTLLASLNADMSVCVVSRNIRTN
ncbi:hypothetical protein BGZ54_003613 [Gamsiella multidivaricata]|nr:hypothetical protein BGZ54_003613 [Gamsiella multidivaricata]